MFNEKNLPKLILITPIAFMALILIVATYIQIIDFNMVYEEETQQLQQIALNKDISNKKIEKLIQDKAIKKKSTIEKIVLVSFLILIIMSLVAFIISRRH